MIISPDKIYSKYGTYIGKLREIAAQKAGRLEVVLNSENQQMLTSHDIDPSLLRALEVKNITTFAELAHMCERDSRINLSRDDIARLIGCLDELTEINKERILLFMRKQESLEALEKKHIKKAEDMRTDSKEKSWQYYSHGIESNEKKERSEDNNTNYGAVKAILHNRKITELIHFTKIRNLTSILEHGLLSVDMLQEMKISYDNNDSDRYDNKTECICTSIEFPNTANLKKFREKYPDASWVILTLDAHVILNHECYFAEHNAATSRIKNNIEMRTTADALEGMFADTVYGKQREDGSFDKYTRTEMARDISCFPTSYQAEVLIKGQIEKEYIRDVAFMNESDKNKYSSLLKQMNINSIVFPDLFVCYRDDFIFEG